MHQLLLTHKHPILAFGLQEMEAAADFMTLMGK
jgi:hypothetical protein